MKLLQSEYIKLSQEKNKVKQIGEKAVAFLETVTRGHLWINSINFSTLKKKNTEKHFQLPKVN